MRRERCVLQACCLLLRWRLARTGKPVSGGAHWLARPLHSAVVVRGCSGGSPESPGLRPSSSLGQRGGSPDGESIIDFGANATIRARLPACRRRLGNGARSLRLPPAPPLPPSALRFCCLLPRHFGRQLLFYLLAFLFFFCLVLFWVRFLRALSASLEISLADIPVVKRGRLREGPRDFSPACDCIRSPIVTRRCLVCVRGVSGGEQLERLALPKAMP